MIRTESLAFAALGLLLVAATPLPPPPSSIPTANVDQSRQTQNPVGNSDTWLRWILHKDWSNWVLVVVGAVASGIALRTLSAIRSQAELAQKSERAWISFNLETVQGLDTLAAWRSDWDFHIAKEGHDLITLVARTSFVNGGKTVAHVKNGVVKFLCANPDELPIQPDYSVLAKDRFEVASLLVLPGGSIPGFWQLTLAHSNASALFTGEVALIIYGFVVYEDIFKSVHESRFCQICRFPLLWPAPVAFVPSGSKSYNCYT